MLGENSWFGILSEAAPNQLDVENLNETNALNLIQCLNLKAHYFFQLLCVWEC